MATGIVASGSGIGSAIFGLFFSMLADPDDLKPIEDQDGNYYFPKEIGNRYPHIQIDLCIVYMFMIAIAIPLMNNLDTPKGRRMSIVFNSSSTHPPQKM